MQYPEEYLIGIAHFNRGDFFESHEAWEDLWRATPRADRAFYQGLIQMAVGLCHYYNGNRTGASRLYHSSRSYLKPFLPHYMGLNLARLLNQVDELYLPVLDEQASGRIELDPSRVPRLVLEPAPLHWPEIPVSDDAEKEHRSR